MTLPNRHDKVVSNERRETSKMGKKFFDPIFSSEMTSYSAIKPDDGKYRDFLFDDPFFEVKFAEEFNGCRFVHVRFSGDLKKIKFIDCHFLSCDFSNLDFSQSLFHRVHFDQCKATGSIFRKSKFKFITFSKCQCTLTDFSESNFEGAIIAESNFSESAFQSCQQTNMKTTHVDFTQADFSDTALAKMDLSGCTMNGVRLSPHLLKGLSVDPQQAIGLVQLLGIIVKDE